MHHITTIEGHLQAKGLRFALVASRFNDFIVDRLVGGAVDALIRHGAERENLLIVRVPGAFDMPVVAQRLAARDDLDGIICLGARLGTKVSKQLWPHLRPPRSSGSLAPCDHGQKT